jgi:hypothetical protein
MSKINAAYGWVAPYGAKNLSCCTAPLISTRWHILISSTSTKKPGFVLLNKPKVLDYRWLIYPTN